MCAAADPDPNMSGTVRVEVGAITLDGAGREEATFSHEKAIPVRAACARA